MFHKIFKLPQTDEWNFNFMEIELFHQNAERLKAVLAIFAKDHVIESLKSVRFCKNYLSGNYRQFFVMCQIKVLSKFL